MHNCLRKRLGERLLWFKNTLANRLGVSERTVNRTISQLLKDGFLTKEGKFLYYNNKRKEVNNVEEDDEEWEKLMSAIEE